MTVGAYATAIIIGLLGLGLGLGLGTRDRAIRVSSRIFCLGGRLYAKIDCVQSI